MRHAIPPSGYPVRAADPDHRGPLAGWSEDVHYELVRRDTSWPQFIASLLNLPTGGNAEACLRVCLRPSSQRSVSSG